MDRTQLKLRRAVASSLCANGGVLLAGSDARAAEEESGPSSCLVGPSPAYWTMAALAAWGRPTARVRTGKYHPSHRATAMDIMRSLSAAT
jgi:hypothetical protein